VFNVDLLWPYFPPLLDNLEITKQLTPIEIKPECTEQASTNHIGHIGQGKSPIEDPTLSGCQSKASPAPRQLVHLGPNSTKLSPSDGGNQHNGEYFFLRRED
jgi:hypothetical protein